MVNKISNKGKILLFILISYSLATVVSQIPGLNGFMYMLTPLVTVLIMLLIITKEGYSKEGWKSLGLHKLGVKMWPFAIIVPLIPLALGYSFVWITGLADLSIPKDFQGFSWKLFPLIVLISLITESLTSSLGEELGWRGYVLPKLHDFGERKALILSGIIHCFWHFPLILLTDLYHSGENLWIMIPLFILTFIFIGPVIGYVRIKTNSVWPASLIHTCHNLYWAVFAYITQSDSLITEYLVGDSGLFIILFYLLMTAFVFKKLKGNSSNGKIAG